eukprot:2844838-Rhodomonas_salina.2
MRASPWYLRFRTWRWSRILVWSRTLHFRHDKHMRQKHMRVAHRAAPRLFRFRENALEKQAADAVVSPAFDLRMPLAIASSKPTSEHAECGWSCAMGPFAGLAPHVKHDTVSRIAASTALQCQGEQQRCHIRAGTDRLFMRTLFHSSVGNAMHGCFIVATTPRCKVSTCLDTMRRFQRRLMNVTKVVAQVEG